MFDDASVPAFDAEARDATATTEDAVEAPQDAEASDARGDATVCQKTATASKVAPDVMIVLDRSASMRVVINPHIDCRGATPVNALDCLGVDCASPAWASTTACGGTMTAGVDRRAPAVQAIEQVTSMLEAEVSFGLTLFPG